MRLLFAALAFTATLAASAQPAEKIDRVMADTLRAWRIPGAAVAVVQDDKVVFVKGYGTKEAGGKEPVTADTLFEIASTSKAFTTTALAMLATDKKLAFDDPVRRHVPYFRLSDMCADANVTLRDIVSHRTGLSRHDELWDDTPLTREEVVRSMAHISPSKPFRSAYQYQNIMFIAAGEAIAQASGMSWEDFMRTRVFEPLKMTRTVTSDSAWAAADHATGHEYDWKTGSIGAKRPIDTTSISSGGALKSCARDMANWLRFQLAEGSFEGKQLVDPELLAETRQPHTVLRVDREVHPETHVQSYAMGWNVQDYRGELMVAHAGALNGFRTHVVLFPEKKTGFVVMINVERGYSLYALRHALADLLLFGKPSREWSSYYLAYDRKSEEKSEKDRQARLDKRVPGTKPTHSLEQYAGTYENAGYGPLKVSVANGALVLEWQRIAAPLTHFHYDVFNAEEAAHDLDETVTFQLDDEKKIVALTVFGERFTKK
jgi:CubicO group peptidase (beta-lactamase class C family)